MGWGITDWYQSKDETLEVKVKVDHHIDFYVWNASMMVNGCYVNHSYMHDCYFIVVMVTCMMDVSSLV